MPRLGLPSDAGGGAGEGGRARVAALVFLLFSCVYLLTLKGITVGDDILHYDQLRSLYVSGRLSLPEHDSAERGPALAPFARRGQDGRPYLTLPLGLDLVAAPLAMLGHAIDEALGLGAPPRPFEARTRAEWQDAFRSVRSRPSGVLTVLVSPLVSAATVVLVVLWVLQLSASLTRALAAGALLGLATILWPYSATYWSQPLASFCLLSALFAADRSGDAERAAGVAGLALGWAVLTRYEMLLLLPWVAGLIAVRRRQSGCGLRGAALRFAVAFALVVSVQLTWNLVRFGSPLDTGSLHQSELTGAFGAKLWRSLPVNLFGLNRSVFVFSPPLVLGLALWPRLWRRDRALAIAVAGSAATILLVGSKFVNWSAAASWGPRFLVPLTPLAALPLAFLPWDRKAWRTAAIVLGGVGLAVQLVGVVGLYDAHAVSDYFGPDPGLRGFLLRSEIVPQLASVWSGNREAWWTYRRSTLPIGAVLLLAAAAAAWGLLRLARSGGDPGAAQKLRAGGDG